jgi:hypothetical protein
MRTFPSAKLVKLAIINRIPIHRMALYPHSRGKLSAVMLERCSGKFLAEDKDEPDGLDIVVEDVSVFIPVFIRSATWRNRSVVRSLVYFQVQVTQAKWTHCD